MIQRPDFHFSAAKGWLNDPNGLCYFKGRYHLFYQYNPYSTDWKKMHWGHAVSEDLVSWSELPVALEPVEWYEDDEGGGCFSGSAIVLEDTMYLLYTAVANGVSRQCAAYSKDGVTFTKYEGNPIIEPPEGFKDFRDPKVFMHEGRLYLVLGGSNGTDNVVFLYEGSDVFTWKQKSVLYRIPAAVGKMPECPDFFPLGDKWVLTCSPMYYEALGHTASAIVGTMDFESGLFTAESFQAVDYGTDCYAAQSFLASDGRTRLTIAWNGEWPWMTFFSGYGETAHEGWRGFMSAPRRLTLEDGRLMAYPVESVSAIFTKELVSHEAVEVDEEGVAVGKALPAVCKASLSVPVTAPDFIVSAGQVSFRVSPQRREVVLFDPRNANVANGAALPVKCGEITIDIFIDHCSIEAFFCGGYSAFSRNDYERSEEDILLIRSLSAPFKTGRLSLYGDGR